MEIWIPDRARENAKPRYQCRVCHDRFVEGQSFEAHVLRCSRVYDNELQQFAADKREEANQIPDPEWEAYNASLRNQGIDPDIQFSRGRKSNIRRARES